MRKKQLVVAIKPTGYTRNHLEFIPSEPVVITVNTPRENTPYVVFKEYNEHLQWKQDGDLIMFFYIAQEDDPDVTIIMTKE